MKEKFFNTCFLYVLCIYLFAISLYGELSAQNYRVINYTNQEGLRIDLTKAVAQDSLGFIWIASDEGLARFDGVSFQVFDEHLPSNYVKGFLQRSNGDFLASTDMGIVKIHSAQDTVGFEQIIHGSSSKTDSTISFVKDMYEDSKNNLWLAEGDAIIKYSDNSIKRYNFGREDRSFNFLRSFTILEDGFGNIIAFSFPGNMHYYDETKDTFHKIELPTAFFEIASAIRIKPGHFIIGASSGLYELKINQNHKVTSLRPLDTSLDVSTLAYNNDNLILIGTWTQGIFQIDLNHNINEVHALTEFSGTKINNIFIAENGDIWVSTDVQVGLLQHGFFEQVVPDELNNYIHSVIHYDNAAYVSDGERIIKLEKDYNRFRLNPYIDRRLYHILYLQKEQNEAWTSNTKGQIHYYKNQKHRKTFDFSDNGMAILYFLKDGNTLWICQNNAIGLTKITDNDSVNFYKEDKGLSCLISIVKKDLKGQLICGGTGENKYLYKYDQSKDKFINLSKELPFPATNSFQVHDIAFDSLNNYYLATSHGLMYLNDSTISRISLDTYTEEAIRAIAIDSTGIIWLGISGSGLMRYHNGHITVFDVADGLPSKTVSFRCITVDNENKKWVGTSRGLAIPQRDEELHTTPKPIIRNVRVNNYPYSVSNLNKEFLKGSLIEIEVRSLSYPGNNIKYQIKKWNQKEWSEVSGTSAFAISLSETGNLDVQFRAKQQGSYLWSEPLTITFNTQARWYERWWAAIIYVIIIGFVFIIIIKWHTRKLVREKEELEAIVNERTSEVRTKNKELEKQKNELSELNAMKDKFFSIISHDLKNPFQSLLGLAGMLAHEYEELEEDERITFVNEIHNSSKRAFSLLENLLQWSRAQRGKLNIQKESILLRELVDDNFALTRGLAKDKNISLETNVSDDVVIYADMNTISTVLRNLITNAIKFTPPEGTVSVLSEASDEFITVTVKDTGVGISPENVKKLFRIDIHHSTQGTNKEKGTGLGLLICKEFIEKNGGTIRVESEEGKGSSFIFTIQRAKGDENISNDVY